MITSSGEPLYEGMIEDIGTTFVVVVRRDGETKQLPHYVRHSPDGFSWGYQGSGCAELARCLLADYLGLAPSNTQIGLSSKGAIPEIDSGLYQQFKSDVIAKLDINRGWTLPGHLLHRWLEVHPPQAVCSQHREPIRDGEPCLACEYPEHGAEAEGADAT
jgi:hypothetical protein